MTNESCDTEGGGAGQESGRARQPLGFSGSPLPLLRPTKRLLAALNRSSSHCCREPGRSRNLLPAGGGGVSVSRSALALPGPGRPYRRTSAKGSGQWVAQQRPEEAGGQRVVALLAAPVGQGGRV